MNCLHFKSPPARPKDGGSLWARQPSVVGLPLRRKCHTDQAAVQPFPGMVVYRRGAALDKRRKLMDARANYCELKNAGKIVEISKRRRSGERE